MSQTGEMYFHSDNTETLTAIRDGIDNAIREGKGVRIMAFDQDLYVAVGGGMWNTFTGTVCFKRDTVDKNAMFTVVSTQLVNTQEG